MGRLRPPRSVADDIRRRSADDLRQLIMARPDLVNPMPADLTELAANVTSPTSVRMAIDNLDATQLSLLRFLSASSTGDALTPSQPLLELAASQDVAVTRLQELWHLGLLWGAWPEQVDLAQPTSALHIVGPVRAILVEAFGRDDTASSFGGETQGISDDPNALVQGAHPLEQMVGGFPADQALERVPATLAHPASSTSPTRLTGSASPANTSYMGVQVAMQAVIMVEDVGLWIQHTRPRQRKRGGIGIRDLTALATQAAAPNLELNLTEASFWVELMAHAGFLGLARPDALSEAFDVTLTHNYDSWSSLNFADQWVQLMGTWFTFDNAPDLVNTLTADGERLNALSGQAKRPVVPSVRRLIISALTKLDPEQALTSSQLHQLVRHRFPRLDTTVQQDATSQVVAEGVQLGVLVRDPSGIYLTGLGLSLATLLDGDSAVDVQGFANAISSLFPAPVDQFIAQADMTLVVPGPPSGTLGQLLGLIANRESTGGASVYRLTPGTLRQAMTNGADPTEILAQLEAKSLTPIPQPMRYLISDAAQLSKSNGDYEGEPVVAPPLRAERSLDGYNRAVGPAAPGGGHPGGGQVEQSSGGTRIGAFGVSLAPAEAEFLAQILCRTRNSPTDDEANRESAARALSLASAQPVPSTDPKRTSELLLAALQSRTPVVIAYVDSVGATWQLAAEVVSVQSGSVTVLDLAERKVTVVRRSQIAGIALTELTKELGVTHD